MSVGPVARSERGQVIPLVVVFMVTLLVFCGLVIDLGNAYRVQQALQASTDAAAAAGAGQLTMSYPANSTNAINQANQFGSTTGGKNLIGGVPSSNVTETVNTSCVISNPNLPCNGPNTVTVTQKASVPTFFLGLLGYNSIGISTSASACSPCNEIPLDIAMVIDRTGSMAGSPFTALKNGVLQGFLPGLDPGVDSVSLSLLPPDSNGLSDLCTAQTSNSYNSSRAQYTVVDMSNDYMDSNYNLNSSSALISAINCMKAGGGTDYSNAMESAYAELNADGRSGVQKVMMILSDGAANTGQNCPAKRSNGTWPWSSDAHCTNPCGHAVADANTYKAAGYLIFTILYNDGQGTESCQNWTGANESPSITPAQAMQQMASPSEYFLDPNPSQLESIFQQISSDMAAGTSRLTS
jgi:Flp pilus assembly protein TadG